MARKGPLWAMRKNDFGKIDPQERGFFRKLDLKKTDPLDPELEKELNKVGFFKWVTYPGDSYKGVVMNTPFELSKRAQRKYEIFCGGFIYFYDEEHPDNLKQLEQQNVEHQIFLAWSEKGDVVRIFMSPKPGNPDPPTTPPPPPPESNSLNF
jgi:hypothetical protein